MHIREACRTAQSARAGKWARRRDSRHELVLPGDRCLIRSVAKFKRELLSPARKKYRLEVNVIGSGPIQAIEVSIWEPKALGRDKLIYVAYPSWSARAVTERATDEQTQRFHDLVAGLIAQVQRQPIESWGMDKPRLVGDSNTVVEALISEYEALNGPLAPWDYNAVWYLGHGEKLAVHRAGIAPERRG